MPRSIRDVLKWYRDKSIVLSESTPKLKNTIIHDLMKDKGSNAQDAIDALNYNGEKIEKFKLLLNNIIGHVKLSCNLEYSEEQRILHRNYAEGYIKRITEIYSELISNTLLEMRDDLGDVISNATNELLESVIETTQCEYQNECCRNNGVFCKKCLKEKTN